MEVDIPENLSDGEITVTLVSVGANGRALASTAFTVNDGEAGEDDGEGVSSWLLVAAGVVATLAAISAQQLYSRRRARYGRK